MANRHHSKKLRAAIRLRMETRGESYQQAHRSITSSAITESATTESAITGSTTTESAITGSTTTELTSVRASKVDLISFRSFGRERTIAILGAADDAIALVLPMEGSQRSPLVTGWVLRPRVD